MKNILQISTLLVEYDPWEASLVRAAFDKVCMQGTFHTANSSTEAVSMLLRKGAYETFALPDLILLGVNVSLDDAKYILDVKKVTKSVVERPVLAIANPDNLHIEEACQKQSLHGVIPRDNMEKGFHDVMDLIVEYWFKGYVDMLAS